MPKNTTEPKRNAQPRDENSGHDLSDDLQSDNGEADEGITNETIVKILFEKPAGKMSSGHSRVFQTKKEIHYSKARKNAKKLVRDGITFLEDAQSKLTDLSTQEIPFEKYYQDFHLPLTVQQNSFEHVQTLFPPVLENLGLRRSAQVDAACSMLKKKGPQRQEALKEFSKYARAQLEQARQNEKDAADASALIKGYKALLRS